MFNQSFILNHGIFLNPNWTRHPDILRVLQIFLLDVVRASFCRELDLQKYLFVFSALLLLIHFLLHCCASAVSGQPVHCHYKKKYGKNIVNIVIAITFYALPSACSGSLIKLALIPAPTFIATRTCWLWPSACLDHHLQLVLIATFPILWILPSAWLYHYLQYAVITPFSLFSKALFKLSSKSTSVCSGLLISVNLSPALSNYPKLLGCLQLLLGTINNVTNACARSWLL